MIRGNIPTGGASSWAICSARERRMVAVASQNQTAIMSSHWHVFSLPPELIQTLVPRTLALPEQQPEPEPEPEQAPAPAPAPTSALSCAACLGITFRDVDEQRAHVRSDWHRYNVKTRLAGGKPVDEPAFALLVSGACVFCSISYII
jgi:hypothetical protein